MENKIVLPEKAKKLLAAALSTGQTPYVYGTSRYGKTTLVKEVLKNKKYSYINCGELLWNQHVAELAKEKVVVLDNLEFMDDGGIIGEIRSLILDPEVQVVLISRAPMPDWLLDLKIHTDFLTISEEMLYLREAEACKLEEKYGMHLERDVLSGIVNMAKGSPYVITYYLKKMMEGFDYSEETTRIITSELVRITINDVFPQWRNDMLDFMTQVCVVDEFNQELAEMITGNQNVPGLLKAAEQSGNFLIKTENGYTFREIVLMALRTKLREEYSADHIRHLEYNVGLYYELHGELDKAAAMYERSGNRSRIIGVLEKNVQINPGAAFYYELKDYYFSLTQEEALQRPSLCAGMSILYSLLMQQEQSEEWYQILADHKDGMKGSLKREAEIWLLWLDIALPHRASTNILQIMESVPRVVFDRGVKLPDFSVTSNLPGIMNGGMDFSSWSKRDKELERSVGWIVTKVLGSYGKGLASAALAESQFNKGGDLYEVLGYLSRAQVEAENGGKDEIFFVTVGLQAAIQILQGNAQAAMSLAEAFEKKIEHRTHKKLLLNVRTLKTRIALYLNDQTLVDEWMKESPDEEMSFYVMERYRYFTKVRVYIQQGEYQKAYMLLQKLDYYTKLYKREYMQIETQLLLSIVKYRMDLEWKENLQQALVLAGEYSFTRLIAMEGAAVSLLLDKADAQIRSNPQIPAPFYQQVREETRKVARYYRTYLSADKISIPALSEHGLQVLMLQAEGKNRQEIAEQLSISIDNVKYHIKQNYRKLGVDNKTDAILLARELHIL